MVLLIFGKPQKEIVLLCTAAAQTSLVMNANKFALILKIESSRWAKFNITVNLYKSSKFRTFVPNEKSLVSIGKSTMSTTYTNFFHHNIGVAIAAKSYFFLSKSNQKDREPTILFLKINFLKNGVRSCRCIFQIEQQIFPTVMCKFWLISFLAYLTFSFLVGEEKCVVMLSAYHMIVNPVLETLEVNIFDCA